jgi:hypothetical protein
MIFNDDNMVLLWEDFASEDLFACNEHADQDR